MLRFASAVLMSAAALAACSPSTYAVRPVPSIAADSVGAPVSRLRDALGAPRKIDSGTTKVVYVWFLEEVPAGAPAGFHGCELEVTVDQRSDHVLGYSLTNLGWAKCPQMQRKIHIAER